MARRATCHFDPEEFYMFQKDFPGAPHITRANVLTHTFNITFGVRVLPADPTTQIS